MSSPFCALLTKLLLKALSPEDRLWPGFARPPADMTGVPADRFF